MTRADVARLDIGRVVSATLRTLGRRWVTLLLLGLPFVILPNLLAAFAPSDLSVARFLTGLPTLIFIGGATLVAYHDMCGDDPVGLGEAISEGFGNFGSLWLVSFISGLATLVGVLLLIVPGVMITAIWAPASAAVVIEDMTSSQALERAWQLSVGSRWRLLGLLVVALLGICLGALVMVVLIVAAMIGFSETVGTALTNYLLTPVMTLAIFEITTVGSTAAYVALRQAREGAPGGLAQVFD